MLRFDVYSGKRGSKAHAERRLATMAVSFLFTSESVGDGHPGTVRYGSEQRREWRAMADELVRGRLREGEERGGRGRLE